MKKLNVFIVAGCVAALVLALPAMSSAKEGKAETKSATKHADDRSRCFLERNFKSDNPFVAAVACTPERIADKRNRSVARDLRISE